MAQHLNINIPAPPKQAIAMAVGAALIMLVGKLVSSNPLFPWLTSGACLLFFVVFNNALAIFSDDFRQYVQHSMMSFLVMVIFLGLAAFLVSGISIFDAKPYRTIYIVMIMAYFSLLAVGLLVRQIVDFLKAKDEKMHGKH